MNNSKPAIIFDLGGVLIDWNPRHLYRQLFDDEAAMEKFLSEVCTPHWNEQQDAGRPFADAVELLVAEHPQSEHHIRAYWDRWLEMIGGEIEPTVTVMAELKAAGYPLYGLSNWSAETFKRTRHLFEFLDWFEDLVISGEVKLIKPDPRIFELLLRKIGRPSHECVYIDDSAANVSAAERLGFEAILFSSAAQLRKELAGLGVVHPEE
ncbi:MAG TPA: HAD family phosphatase [Blastocatellia bacterium]|nr:HAD family phosphatase [Blastocatellia bacterium]